MSKVIIVEEDRCLSCGSCKLECALVHSGAATLAEAVLSGIPLESRIYVEPMGQFGMPVQCRHCQDAPCMTVCPTEAIHRDSNDGPVLLDQNRCIVCRLCVLVCPFGVIHVSQTGKAIIKCDLCAERTAAGEEPACVAACPTDALQFQETTTYVGERRRQATGRLVTSIQVAGALEGTPYGSERS
jgi:carbon-monoxide dehydrogenase iron sulfur subunit